MQKDGRVLRSSTDDTYTYILCTWALIVLSSAQTLTVTMLPSQTGQIWPSPGELDSCRRLRSLQDPKNAELAAKVQKCCPELAVLGANETGVFYPTSFRVARPL